MWFILKISRFPSPAIHVFGRRWMRIDGPPNVALKLFLGCSESDCHSGCVHGYETLVTFVMATNGQLDDFYVFFSDTWDLLGYIFIYIMLSTH